MMAHVNQTLDPAMMYSFRTVNIIRLSKEWTLVALALELSIKSGFPEAFAAFYSINFSNGSYLVGGVPTNAYQFSGALLITPSSECFCL